jgi:hypothetical protein
VFNPLFYKEADMRFALYIVFSLSSFIFYASFVTPSTAASLELIGTTKIPSLLSFEKTDVGGLSALEYDPVKDEYYAQSDDRSERSPSRFYGLKIDYTDKTVSEPRVLGVTLLKNEQGQIYKKQEVDPESFRLLGHNRILWGSEGNIRVENYSPPAVRVAGLDGQEQVNIPLPPQIKTEGFSGTHGMRYNLGFEALTLDPTQPEKRAWTSNEGALLQDGDAPSQMKETPLRLFELDLERGEFTRQFVYMLDRVPDGNEKARGYRDNGLAEMLAVDSDTLITLERAFIEGKGYSIRLYETKLRGATDVAGCMALSLNCVYKPVEKKLLVNLEGKLENGVDIENLEGMTWGKPLPDGTKTLVFIADDNFAEKQVTQVAVFKYIP